MDQNFEVISSKLHNEMWPSASPFLISLSFDNISEKALVKETSLINIID